MKKQTITHHEHYGFTNPTCDCGKCGKTIGLRDAQLNGATGLAWFDPYNRNLYFHSSNKYGAVTFIWSAFPMNGNRILRKREQDHEQAKFRYIG